MKTVYGRRVCRVCGALCGGKTYRERSYKERKIYFCRKVCAIQWMARRLANTLSAKDLYISRRSRKWWIEFFEKEVRKNFDKYFETVYVKQPHRR